jgi:hypothetical protein
MSEKEKKEFDEQFQSAISASLKKVTVSDDLRKKLMGRLQTESRDSVPQGLSEEVASDFEHRFAQAIQKSQEWAPEEKIALRAESVVSAEAGRNMLSERSVQALLDGAQAPEELAGLETPADKIKFLQTVRSEVRRTTQELTAPESVREGVLKALKGEKPAARGKVIAFPTRAQWSRGLKTLTSLAAAFALVFLTIFGSADAALANSVRADHKMCCDKALKLQPNGPPTGIKAMLQSKYGSVPVPPVDDSWDLRVSNVCRSDDGQPMVHLLYTRDGKDGELESISFHFLPDQEGQRADKYSLNESKLHEISDGDFPVVGWTEGGWVCTACSPELSADQLKQAFAGGI